jgi:hypothetical protein
MQRNIEVNEEFGSDELRERLLEHIARALD